MPTKYSQGDAQKGTGSSADETQEAWHQAREDARASGELNDRPAKDPSPKAENEPVRTEFSDRITGGKVK